MRDRELSSLACSMRVIAARLRKKLEFSARSAQEILVKISEMIYQLESSITFNSCRLKHLWRCWRRLCVRTRLPWQCEIASGACRSLTPKLMYYVIRGSIHPLSAFVQHCRSVSVHTPCARACVCGCVCACEKDSGRGKPGAYRAPLGVRPYSSRTKCWQINALILLCEVHTVLADCSYDASFWGRLLHTSREYFGKSQQFWYNRF